MIIKSSFFNVNILRLILLENFTAFRNLYHNENTLSLLKNFDAESMLEKLEESC